MTFQVLEIHDLQGNRRVLAVDLRHVLIALGESAKKSTWVVSKAEPWADDFFVEATGEGAVELEQLAESGERVTGLHLLDIANRTHQVIWGVFLGFHSLSGHTPWIIVHAVDSSYFEVHTNDNTALQLIKNAFTDVRPGRFRKFKLD